MAKDDYNQKKGSLSLYEELGPELDKERLEEIPVDGQLKPVFHLCQFKKLIDDEDSNSMLKMEARFIQVTYHDKKELKADKEGGGKDVKPSFDYRINSKKPQEEDCQLRSERIIWESDEKCITKTILDVVLPLEITPIFTMYLFNFYKAEVSIELVSKALQNVTLIPNIAINTKHLTRNFTVETRESEIDKSKKYDFVTTCPSVQYFKDRSNKECCKKFSVDFLLVDAAQNFLKLYFPLFLACIVSTVDAMYNTAAETSSAEVFAIFSFLPEAIDNSSEFLDTRSTQIHAIIIILGLIFVLLPSSFNFPYEKVGIVLLWSSFCFPIYYFSSSLSYKESCRNQSCEEKHYDTKKGKMLKFEDIKDCEYVVSLDDNFKYPQDEKNTEDNKEAECPENSKGFLYRRTVPEKSFGSYLFVFCYICILFVIMRKSLGDIILTCKENITGYDIPMENMECVSTE